MSQKPAISWQLATVKNIREENARVKTYTLELPHWVDHIAGQHYDLRLTAPDGYQAQRSYSVASAPGQPGIIELTVENLEDGEVSYFMHEVVQIGDQLEVRGPIGGYFIWKPEQTQPLLLIGGGSGIVPLMAMVRHRATSNATVFTTLLYSTRSPQQAIYADELRERQQKDKNLAIIFTYTRTSPTDWSGYNRRIDKAILQEVLQTYPVLPLVYVCGPTAFVENTANHLLALDIPASSILTERFGPTGS